MKKVDIQGKTWTWVVIYFKRNFSKQLSIKPPTLITPTLFLLSSDELKLSLALRPIHDKAATAPEKLTTPEKFTTFWDHIRNITLYGSLLMRQLGPPCSPPQCTGLVFNDVPKAWALMFVSCIVSSSLRASLPSSKTSLFFSNHHSILWNTFANEHEEGWNLRIKYCTWVGLVMYVSSGPHLCLY